MEGLNPIDIFGGMHFLAASEVESDRLDDSAPTWSPRVFNDQFDEETSDTTTKKPGLTDEWTSKPASTAHPIPSFHFTGMKFSFENCQPFEIFNHFLTLEFLRRLVDETNKSGKTLHNNSDFGNWKHLKISELKVFLGLLYHTGTIRLDNLSDHWSSHKLFDLKVFNAHMTKNRFMKILSALRYDSVKNQTENIDMKSLAVRSIVEYFNYCMEETCYCSRDLIVDGCIGVNDNVADFLGNPRFNYEKPALYVHFLSASNGLVHKILATEYKNTNSFEVVKSLMEGKTQNGHHLYLNSDYCTVELVENMLAENTYCTGILNSRRKSIPSEVIDVEDGASESVQVFCRRGVSVVKWLGSEEVIAVSNEFCDVQKDLNNPRCVPTMIKEYHKVLCEVERRNIFGSYRIHEDENTGWYLRFLFQVLQAFMRNAYLLYKDHVKEISYHEFRLSVIENLLRKQVTVDEAVESSEDQSSLDINPATNDSHVPKKFPRREGRRALRRRCRVCLGDNKRTDTYFHCPQCPEKPALCLEGCFSSYHQVKALKIGGELEVT